MAKKRKPTIEINFSSLLNDITYTNRVMKTHDVSHIITRNQFYQLKDKLIMWMINHKFTTTSVDGMEYTIDKNMEKLYLVKLTLSIGDTVCHVHQNFSKSIRNRLQINPDNFEIKKYEPEYSYVEYDEEEFEKAIRRMRLTRIIFMRESTERNLFFGAYATNLKSGDPWMKEYISFLPRGGNVDFKVIKNDDVDISESMGSTFELLNTVDILALMQTTYGNKMFDVWDLIEKLKDILYDKALDYPELQGEVFNAVGEDEFIEYLEDRYGKKISTFETITRYVRVKE